MKTALKFLAYVSVLINVYVFAIWIYIFNTSNNQLERVGRFNQFVPSFNAIYIQTFILLLLSAVSIFYLARTTKTYNKVIMALQIFFAFLYVFQHM